MWQVKARKASRTGAKIIIQDRKKVKVKNLEPNQKKIYPRQSTGSLETQPSALKYPQTRTEKNQTLSTEYFENRESGNIAKKSLDALPCPDETWRDLFGSKTQTGVPES